MRWMTLHGRRLQEKIPILVGACSRFKQPHLILTSIFKSCPYLGCRIRRPPTQSRCADQTGRGTSREGEGRHHPVHGPTSRSSNRNSQELKKRIETLAQRHQLTNVSRLSRVSAIQTQLNHRLLKVVQHLHLLIPSVRSSSIRPEEEVLRATLEEIDEDIRRPGGVGKMRGKLNQLWALVDAVRAARDRDRQDGLVEWAVVDDEGLNQITQVSLPSIFRGVKSNWE